MICKFRDCFDLTSITLPNTITNIETKTFWGCHVLESIIIPRSVKSIGDYAFGRCLQLKSVIIPSSTTTISSNAFSFCSELTSVTVGNSEPISISNFTNRTNATLYVPAGSKAAYAAASIWNEFKEIIEVENITFADSKVKEICVVNWDTNGDGELSYAEAAVSSIGKTFKDNKAITSFDELQYFTGVKTIKANAFYGCNSLVSVTLPNTVKEIQQNAFFATSLESIKIPASVNTIEAAAFNSCNNIKSIVVEERNAVYDSRNNCNGIVETATNTLIVGCMNTIIPDDITSIGASVFRGNLSLKQIVIPNSVTSIGTDAFYNCKNLVSITLGWITALPDLGERPFNKFSATLYVPAGSKDMYENDDYWTQFNEIVEIKNISFADSKVKEICVANWDADKDGELNYPEAAAVTSLGEMFKGNTEIKAFNELQYFVGINEINNYAFYGCTNLESVVLPKSVKSIMPHAFENCEMLNALHIPANVSYINDAAIRASNGLVRLTVDESNPVFDSRNNCNAVIETATNTLIVGCNTSVIPNGIEAIGVKAFRDMTKLFSVIIPNSVTAIGDNAFDGCDRLTSVTVGNKTPFTISKSVFSNRSNATLYVPAGSREAYQAAGYWKEFKEIIEIDNISFADSNVKETLLNADFGDIGLGSWNTCVSYENISVTVGDYVLASDDFEDDKKWTHNIGDWAIIDGKLQQGQIAENCTSVFDLPARGTYSYKVRARKDSGNEGFLILFNRVDDSNLMWWNIGGWDNKANGIEVITNGANKIVAYEDGTIETGRWYDIEIRLTEDDIICLLDNVVIHRIDRNLLHRAVDSNGDNEIAKEEAAAITDIGTIFKGNKKITSFNELQYFTGVTSLSEAFNGCSNLVSVKLPESLERLRDSAFENCTSLSALHIPANVNFVGNDVIRAANALTVLTVDENNEVYDSRNNCNAVIEKATNTLIVACNTSVIPNGVETIGSKAFRYMTGLTSIAIPNSVTKICEKAFDGCVNLEALTIPNSVTTFESCVGSCDNLSSIIVEEGNKYYDSRNNCNAIIETATNTLISGCKNTIIPNGISKIRENAFYHCIDLTSITIPSTVTSIGAQAFAGCYSLDTVTVGNSTPVELTDGSTFSNRANATLYVPAGSKTSYKNAEVWKEFKDIVGELTITLNQYGKSTYCSEYALDFTNVEGLKAYVATGYNTRTGMVTMTRVMTTKGGTGLFLKGEQGSYKVPVIDESDDNTLNLLVGTLTKVTVNSKDDIYTNYKFTVKAGETEPDFYNFADNSTLSANKAYLRIPTAWLSSTSAAKSVRMWFEDEEATGIDEINTNRPDSDTIYDMQGRRVKNPSKGMYIVNGKKMIMK